MFGKKNLWTTSYWSLCAIRTLSFSKRTEKDEKRLLDAVLSTSTKYFYSQFLSYRFPIVDKT